MYNLVKKPCHNFDARNIAVKLNGARMVSGILRGFDPFMNLVIDEGTETSKQGEQHNIGMVVRLLVFLLKDFTW